MYRMTHMDSEAHFRMILDRRLTMETLFKVSTKKRMSEEQVRLDCERERDRIAFIEI